MSLQALLTGDLLSDQFVFVTDFVLLHASLCLRPAVRVRRLSFEGLLALLPRDQLCIGELELFMALCDWQTHHQA